MKRKYSLKNKQIIDNLFKNTKPKKNDYFLVYLQKVEQKNFKFLIGIGKKYGNAVRRNLMKRKIRYIIYDIKDKIKPENTFALVVSNRTKELTFTELKKELTRILIKTKVMEL